MVGKLLLVEGRLIVDVTIVDGQVSFNQVPGHDEPTTLLKRDLLTRVANEFFTEAERLRQLCLEKYDEDATSPSNKRDINPA